MSAILHCQNLTKSFGTKRLFHNLNVGVQENDRLGIIGPNGSGKSTLLKILAGLEQADEGQVIRRQHLRVAYIPQQLNFDDMATVEEEIEKAAKHARIPQQELQGRVQEILGKMGFEDEQQEVGSLSGGWKKRLGIACGFVQDPEVMLLDEPTNHLDLEGIRWLKHIMSQAPWPWVIVSHDRWFLEHATNKVAELNARYPDGIFLTTGTYGTFVTKRDEFEMAQAQQMQALKGKVRREEEWLRRGPKARTTKAKARIDQAHALQTELAATSARLRQEETTIDFVGTGRKTKRLVVAESLKKSYEARTVMQNVELVLSPGMALGVLGYNGSGKSTLLKMLAKEIDPDQGTVTHAQKLQVVYFDQDRAQLNPQETLRRTLSDTGHTVTYRGQTIHLAGWIKRFRFQPEQLDLPIHLLSGGEQARAVIAKLMLQPADVLIVDEPTNDLDIPTREVLEESLHEFPGALVLVTHDRYMLEEVCSRFFGLDGKGHHGMFAEYGQWESWLRQKSSLPEKPPTDFSSKKSPSLSKYKKLSYRDQQDYDTIEQRVLDAEALRDKCRAKTEESSIASDHVQIQETYETLEVAEKQVEQLYARWAELEAKRSG